MYVIVELSSFNGDMMRMGKREGQELYDSDLRFGKRGKNLLIHFLKKVCVVITGSTDARAPVDFD